MSNLGDPGAKEEIMQKGIDFLYLNHPFARAYVQMGAHIVHTLIHTCLT